jgi:hypothetical protein
MLINRKRKQKIKINGKEISKEKTY